MKGQWSGLELKSITILVSLGQLYRDGNRAFSLLQGRKLPTSDRVISACGGKAMRRERKSVCARTAAPALPKPRSIFPWGGSVCQVPWRVA